MIAKNLLNTAFTPLQSSDKISAALAKMDAWQSSDIPVIEPSTRKIVGSIQFEDIADHCDETQVLVDVQWKPPVYTFQYQHIFEVARKMLLHDIRLLAVIDENETYLGIIEKRSVLEALSAMLNISASGSVITVYMQKADFTLARLVHLIETEDAKILGLTVEQPDSDESLMQISIKLNLVDSSTVTSSLNRHGYVTTSVNRQDLLQVDLTSRANELIRYLDL